MAVFTKINKADISKIENSFKLGKIINYHGIKKGIENTNYYIQFKNQKTVLTIFEKRVNSKDLPFFMNLMDELSKLKIVCPSPIKNRKCMDSLLEILQINVFTWFSAGKNGFMVRSTSKFCACGG